MKKLLICLLFCLSILQVFTITGCTKKAQNAVDQPHHNTPVLLGSLISSAIKLDKNNMATVYFVASSTAYKLDLNKISANATYNLLLTSKNKLTPVKVYIYRNSQEIAKIEQ